MKIVILGGGVIGVTSAWYLAKAGHQVTLLERQGGVALETSHANAGQISPGYAAPWAAPGIPLKAAKWMLQKHAPFTVRPTTDPFQLRWMLRMFANCTPTAYATNKGRMVRLAEYSRDCMKVLRDELSIDYEGAPARHPAAVSQPIPARCQSARYRGTGGVWRPLPVPRCQQAAKRQSRRWHGYAAKSSAACVCPATRPATASASPRPLPLKPRSLGSSSSSTAISTRLSRAVVVIAAAPWQCGQASSAIAPMPSSVRSAAMPPAFLRPLLRPLGLELPVYPVKGYSLTLPMINADAAPRSTVLDETYKVAITRFDERIRVGGMAELSGYNLALNPRRHDTLAMVVGDLFPEGGDISQAEFWTGLRPMTPDGTPLVGPSPIPGLWLNTGHGTLGWTMAAGSGQLLCDLISGSEPAISDEGLTLARYG